MNDAANIQRDNLSRFRDLHAPRNILVLPNSWDAASARLAQEAGAKAVATSSAAVAWSNGYADHETMPRDVVLAAARATLRVVTVPVSVDSEAGYSAEPAQVAEHVMALIDLGVVGINLEDDTDPPDLLVRKITAIKTAARATGRDIFINARADVYLANLVPDDQKLAETVRRARLYRDAGADGFFAPAAIDLGDIRQIVESVDLPVNILIMPGVPAIAELRAAGVRRVSAGGRMGRTAYGAAQRATAMLLDDGTYDLMFTASADCPNFNALFA